MPSREDERWRNIRGHDAMCNCAVCVTRRVHAMQHEEQYDQYKMNWDSITATELGTKTPKPMKIKSRRLSNVVVCIERLCLNLAILAVFGLLVYFGYVLFGHYTHLEPTVEVALFIATLVGWVLLIKLARSHRFKWTAPSFKLTLLSIIGVVLILSFTGAQPMAHYKDIVVDRIAGYYEGHGLTPEGYVTTLPEDDAATAAYEELFNEFRLENGLQPLLFTSDLDRVAALRVEEIRVDFSHYSVGGYNLHLGENIAMRTGFLSDFAALSMWEDSPGHRANALSGDYEYTGYANSGGYAVQVFTQFVTIGGVPQLPPGWCWDE